MKKLIIFIILILIAVATGYYLGRQRAFSDIVLEKCWLRQPENVIACYVEME